MNKAYTPPSPTLTQRILQLLQGVKQTNDGGWTARCPGHDDKHNSLSVAIGDDGRVLMYCHAQCEIERILAALNLKMDDLFPPEQRKQRSQNRDNKDSRYAEIYDYADAEGQLLYQVCRLETFVDGKKKKDFPIRRFGPYGKEVWGLGGIEPVLYHLPEVLKEIEGDGIIWLVEGEKDADRLRGAGITATTAPLGAKQKWRPSYTENLKGSNTHVAILGDNDPAGRKRVQHVAAHLYGQVESVKVLDLRLEQEHGDISDWLDMGHTISELLALRKDTPNWQPTWHKSSEVTVELGIGNTYIFGRRCVHKTFKKVNGEETLVDIPFASDVWPRERYRSVENDEYGYRLIYPDPVGEPRHITIPAGASVDANAGKKACVDLANAGVDIAPDSRGALAISLGHWARKLNPPLVHLVETSGWHGEKVYVNGNKIFGAPNWYVNEQSPAIVNRTGRGGDLEGWRTGIAKHLTTPGLRIALAQSLAGALIEPLHLHPFALHLWVDSTRGKSTAAMLAAALWGHPDATFKTWNTTAKSPEALAEQMNGACLVLDEIAQFEGDQKALSQTIHALCSPIGRSALDKNRDLSVQRRWRCTLLSTGEISTRQRIGELYQGGHRVRFLDLYCGQDGIYENGALATSKQHAEQIAQFCHNHYGHASDAWIAHLAQPGRFEQIRKDYDEWRDLAESYTGSNPENGRIGAQLAVCAVALAHANLAGLAPWSTSEVVQILRWSINAVLKGNADSNGDGEAWADTPNGRAYEQFINLLFSDPARFPNVNNLKVEFARDVIAYKLIDEHDVLKLYTTEGMLSKADIVGVGTRGWVTWCTEIGMASRDKATLPNGLGQKRWVVFTPKM